MTTPQQAPSRRPPRRRDGPSGRFYALDDGTELPSVTHILGCIGKPALITWAANQERDLVVRAACDLYTDLAHVKPMAREAYKATLTKRCGREKAHRRELDRAGNIGTQVHKLIEWSLRKALKQQVGPEPRVVDEALWAYMAFQDWAQEHKVKPRLIEQIVYSREYGYAGTMDLLADVDGVPTLVDFKTGKAVYREAHLQNVAYQVALEEMGHGRPEAGCIVRLPKLTTDPEFEVVPCPPRDELLTTFLAVKKMWQWWHEGELEYQRARKARTAGDT